MKVTNIKDKLAEMGIDPQSIVMGDFDAIGEFTAKRQRGIEDPNYKKYGAYYRANYERGILIYFLIRCFNIQSVLEIGFGRGYSAFCAAKAFHDGGINGKITTVDPALDEKQINPLTQVFPKQWFEKIQFVRGPSQTVVPGLEGNFDLIYIDGDHSYEATKTDWENCKSKNPKIVLFDDYHLPTKEDPGIQCAKAIDEIDWNVEGFDAPELIRLDRRMFLDERGYTDDQVNYGQVLAFRKGVNDSEW